MLVFLIATAIGAFVAFMAGISAGARASSVPFWDRIAAAHIDHTDAVWDCNSFGGAPGLRTIMNERVCGEAELRARRPCTPLRRSLVQTVADKRLAGGEPVARKPDFFAMPSAATSDITVETGSSGAGGDGLGAPTITSAALDPFLLTGARTATPLVPPVIDPPAEVPGPAALPLMATGLLAFRFLRRRRAT